MTARQHIGIAGAGLLGRLAAWQLTRLGHMVSVYDPAPDAAPRFRDGFADPAQAVAQAQAAGFTAAGMLSPIAELDNAEPALAARGWRSIALWRDVAEALSPQPFFAARGSLMLAHRPDLGSAQRVLDRLRTAVQTPAWQAASPKGGVQPLTVAELRALEPSVQGPSHAWLLPGEAQIDAVQALLALQAAAQATGLSHWHWQAPVQSVHSDGTLTLASGECPRFDWVLDARGLGAAPQVPVRGVRGEMVWLHAPGHGVQRPIRLLHPRHRVYIVPRPGDLVLVGASEIESEDRSPVSLRSAVELMAAAHSVVPALAEARIVHLDVNLRPALPDNGTLVVREAQRLRINGLFRHGWLLAPALLEEGLALMSDAAPATQAVFSPTAA